MWRPQNRNITFKQITNMKIAVAGTGYVGLSIGIGLERWFILS